MQSIASLAEDLGVTPAIIRSWQINLNLKIPKYGNDELVFNQDWQVVFHKVAQLRKEGQSFSKIRLALAALLPSEASLPEPGSQATPAHPKTAHEKTFHPEDLKSANITPPVIRSDLSSQERLGIYGPATEIMTQNPASSSPTETFQPKEAVAQTSNNAATQIVLPALVSDSKQGMGALQTIQNNMHEAILQKDLQKMTHTYVQLVENYQALASRYSESTYLIGQMEEKQLALEEKLIQERSNHQEKVKDLEAHLNSLKDLLNTQTTRLDQQSASLVTKNEIDQVEKQIKLLAVTVFKQQQQQAENKTPEGFWAKLKSRLFS